ncbi:MAG TPA: DUF2092 domain-containing protein [Sphingomicrobium sp.]|jgi:hypothetical protein
MSINRSVLPLAAFAIAAAAVTSGCQKKGEAPAGQGQVEPTEAAFPDFDGDAPAPQAKVDPAAVQAIHDMSKYLTSLNSFKLNTEGTLDTVTADGQRIQMDGSTAYAVKKPGFAIKYTSDKKNRDFFYDGKQFTVYSPNLGYYASVPAPPTNREVLDTVYDKYGVRLPLEDLFRWNDADQKRDENFRAAYNLGTVTLDGVKTTHYAFREPDVDWEVWIDQGDKPLPRKLSIVDRTDPARPAFTTRLKWQPNAAVSASEVTFAPGPDAMKIAMAQYKGQ